MNRTKAAVANAEAEDYPYYNFIRKMITAMYGVLSLSLVCHLTVGLMLIKIIKTSKNKDTLHSCIYILALTIVDALVISHLPMLVVEMSEQEWKFGLWWCRFFWFAETVNKILSTYLLTAICFDRFVAICYPVRAVGALRSPRTACVIIFVCACFALLLLAPIYSSATLEDAQVSANQTSVKCVVEWSEGAEKIFTITLFVIGYCIPLVLMTYFYFRIILRLRERNLSFRKTSVDTYNGNGKNHERQLRSVTAKLFLLVFFYFVCWTPFWGITLSAYNGGGYSSNATIAAFYLIHALVYLNSAMNPVLYALFNKNLRKEASGKRGQFQQSHTNLLKSTIRGTNVVITEDAETIV